MFKGKNLIFILAESFNEIAIDENLTPTLYRLSNNGFKFNNFYSPSFFSTTGGEFLATTGLIPTSSTLERYRKNRVFIPYGFGNIFSKYNYRVQSFHDWTYSYYERDNTMLNLGIDNYMAFGNGLEKYMNTKWLTKDSEMTDVTTPLYLGKDGNFATYYITMSGHPPYTGTNNVASQYYDKVKDMNCSFQIKNYLASQIELDKMVEHLIEDLEESGELDNTVIALVGDHYPYTIPINEINQISTYERDETIEASRSKFIIWNNEMKEPVTVDKVGCQLDVLPTLLNLFGIEYDSRLILGKDLLSNAEGIAMFPDNSWVTEYGTYYAKDRKFVLKPGITLDNQEEYVKRLSIKRNNYFSVSKMIIFNDYYKNILGE